MHIDMTDYPLLDKANLPEQLRQLPQEQLPQLSQELRQFLLKSLDKTETGFRWRFNLDALSTHYQALIGAPAAQGVFDGPTLFIKGGNSDYILAEHRPTILAHFPAAQAKVIEGTGHWLHAEKPREFEETVRIFLDTPSPEQG